MNSIQSISPNRNYVSFGANKPRMTRMVANSMLETAENVKRDRADLLGSLVKSSGSGEAFVDFMLYKPFYIAKLQLKGGSIPLQEDGIKQAIDIIDKKTYPKKIKGEAILFLSELAKKMKEKEQNLLKESNRKDGWGKYITEELLPALRKEIEKLNNQIERLVKDGKLDYNPFLL